MEKHHQDVLERNWSVLCSELDPSLVADHLIQKGFLSLETKDRICAGRSRSEGTSELLSTLFAQKDAFGAFVESLRLPHRHLYEMVICGGENRPINDSEVEVLRTELKGKYESLSRFHPMPWLPHQLPLTNVFTKLQLVSPGSQQDPLLLDRDQQPSLDNLFTPHELSRDPKRILVEGEAGIGKTTLLQMLVSKWNEGNCGEKCGSPCVHSFDLLFNLHAKDFIGCTSIPDVIKSCLLARDSEISTEILEAILQMQSVVLVVDAYDEEYMENHLLNDVIEGRVLKDATVLLSCRPAFLKFRFFDSIFVVHGFDEEHQIEYVERFAHEINLSSNSLLKLQQKMSNELQDLCRNPFILTILCMLCSENSAQLPSTRAGVYKAVHEFFIEKASRKMGRDKEDIKRTVIFPLAKLSFEIYNKEKHLIEEDFDDLSCSPEEACQIGYVSVDETVSSLQNATRCYRFGHRSLQEYLATIHLGKMAAGERLAWLRSKNVYQIDTIIIFLFGQLNDEDLESTAAVIMEDMRFQPLQFSNLPFYSCSQSHLVLHCLNELAERDISDELKSVLAENCPLRIHISRDCSISCIQGVSMICSLIKKEHSVCLTFDLDATKDFVPLMKQLKRCKCISYVQLNYHKDKIKLEDCLRALQVGRALSCVRGLIIGHSDIGKVTPELNIGPHMYSMTLIGCKSLSFSRRFLEAVMGQKSSSFRGLHLTDCCLDHGCFEMLQQILKKFHRYIRYLNILNINNDSSFRVADLLSDIAGLSNLRSLDISLDLLNRQEISNFKSILQKNTLQRLRLIKCTSPKELHDALSHCFPKMSTLRHLSFFFNEVHDSAAFRRMISAIRHLHCLESINIKMTPLNDEILEVLSLVLSELKDIKWVTLVKIGRDHHPSRLQNVFRAIASCKRITSLIFADMHIDDALMPSICEMVESLEDLQDLTLWKNTFSANALEDLSVALERRPNRLNILDIADIEGNRSERVVKLLRKNCRSVIHD
ncbi:hypothetical protein CAPTEDRAFT_186284 [Capitella teleta]|uniref:NACHT domain-containing protein n=1 Tax=Capitella teleta TaxID=283909 RepID=R7V809_CAPTE|nr:hypothetical protein CAPTEDRAFT_186284 [Capitella teleta]|eukprot:ELU14998.1 hypothetical protein CAPTEDRAFT_186284 [Capitella teleta]